MSQSDYVWWKHGVVYHIYPRSFFDSNRDGIGDLRGIIQKMDYISSLGINTIWLSPIFLSSNYDYGYDVTDYYSIDPSLGSEQDFLELVNQCHSRNIKIILDFVMNHTSIDHPWFIESRSSVTNPKRNWYIWANKKPNNWKSFFGGGAWQRCEQTGQYYLHSFLPEQPDLNWRNDEVKKEFYKIAEFWLKKGVDGFRLDAINLLIKDKQYRSNPRIWFFPFFFINRYNRNRAGSLKIISKLRKLTDSYGDKLLVGEICSLPPGNTKLVRKYLRKEKARLQLAFDFSLIFKPFRAKSFYNYINKWEKQKNKVEWLCHVLSNHDLGRHTNRIPFRRNIFQKSIVELAFMLTIRGTPFVYYGDEIGMQNIKISSKLIQDPIGKKLKPFFRGRDGFRTPMQWTTGDNAGFSEEEPWLPVENCSRKRCVETQEHNEDSQLNLFRKLLSIRNNFEAFQKGNWKPYIKGKNGILAYFRKHEDESMLVILNFRNNHKKINLPQNNKYKVLFSNEKSSYNHNPIEVITLKPYHVLILQKVL